jgi:3-dehydroquinate synthase II
MRELWIHIDENMDEGAKKKLIQAASEKKCTVIVEGSDLDLAKTIGVRTASSCDGEIAILREEDWGSANRLKSQGRPACCILSVRSGEDEVRALRAVEAGVSFIVINCVDWKVIPLENLIAKTRGRAKLLAEVSNAQEAKLAIETLELGVDGVVIRASDTKDVNDVASVLDSLEQGLERGIPLTSAKVVIIKQLGLGYRVCVDTCDLMSPGEGMLVGCQSTGLFLIQAEVQENPHVEPRPFRVNAGPVSLYILTPGNKTRYLSEIRCGDEVLVVRRDGQSRPAIVSRAKIERRPLMLIETEADGKRLKTIVQNAETIRLINREGSKPVTELKEGDEVLVFHQTGGRHFGVLVSEETIIER